ncbi:MAG: hypothetical protein ACREMJ_12835 [Gemmatimonadales bacterium]
MTERLTPFGLVFGDIAPHRFPAVARALAAAGRSSDDPDAFVLLEPVAHLVRELVPEDATPDELEAHLRLLHHAYRHWSAGGWVYRVGEETLARATREPRIAAHLPQPAVYVQLPAGRAWRGTLPDAAPEPLDGMFVTETPVAREVRVLAIFGMHRNRPGFSAVAVEGRPDEDDAADGALEVAAARDDGSAVFAPLLEGGERAGLYSVANAGELLLLTCRLLALLPPAPGEPGNAQRETSERFMNV